MRREFAGLSYVLGLATLLCSCASLGTKVEVRNPELVNAIRVVGLAPIYVDGLTLSVCEPAESLVLAALVSQIEQSGAFRVVSADTLMAHIQGEDVNRTLDWDSGYTGAGTLLACAHRLNLDGVLFCKLEAWQGKVVIKEPVGEDESSGTAEWNPLAEEPVYEPVWLGAKVSLQIAESSAGKLVIATKFDTMKGTSYRSTAHPEKQIADAVMGAFKPVAQAWAKRNGGSK